MKTKALYIILFIVFLCDLFFVFSGKTTERFFTKTLLLPLMIAIYYTESQKLNNLFVLGMFFSFLGDLFLLFSWGFLPGLGSFMLAHIFYIFCFKNLSQARIPIAYLIAIGAYILGLLTCLFPHLEEMKIPVIVYAITIGTMLIFSIKTKNKFLTAGALFFVISDSLLAVDLFMKQTLILNMMVMVTYVVAQFLLLKGILIKKVENSVTF